MSLSSSDESDDLLSSDTFDPLTILYSKDIEKRLRPGQYCVFDNLSSIESYLKRSGGDLDVKFEKNKSIPKSTKNEIPDEALSVRRFLPHQQMITVQRVKKYRHIRSVFTDNERLEGPLKNLGLWMKEGVRVKVLIRKSHGIRGFITGIIRLFDKHWNLTVSDVHERFRRRKFAKSTELSLDCATELEAFKRFKELKLPHPMKDPNTEIKAIDKKRLEIRRRHKLLFIKGDQVAVVTKYIEGFDSY